MSTTDVTMIFFRHMFYKFFCSHWIVIERLDSWVRIMLWWMVSNLSCQIEVEIGGPHLWCVWIWCEKELPRELLRTWLPGDWEVFLLWRRQQLRTLIDPIAYAQTSHQCSQEGEYLLRCLLRGHSPWRLSFVHVSPRFKLVYFNGASWLPTEKGAVIFQLL